MLTAQLQITGTRSLHLHEMIGTSKRKTSRMDLSRDTFKNRRCLKCLHNIHTLRTSTVSVIHLYIILEKEQVSRTRQHLQRRPQSRQRYGSQATLWQDLGKGRSTISDQKEGHEYLVKLPMKGKLSICDNHRDKAPICPRKSV